MDTLIPMRGICFVRPVETEETISGGAILLPESYRQRITAQQAEIVAVGPPSRCDEPEDCERPHSAGVHVVDHRIIPGAWVLCAKWAYVGIRDKLFAVRHEDIIGVFPTSEAVAPSPLAPPPPTPLKRLRAGTRRPG